MRAILTSRYTWGVVAATAVIALLLTFAYVKAFLDPSGEARDVPVAIVSEDAGASIAGTPFNAGRELVAALTAPGGSEAAAFVVLGSRDDVLERMGDNDVYAAVVVPAGFSAEVAALAAPRGEAAVSPATVEILTNQASGTIARSAGLTIATQALARFERAIAAQLAESSQAAGGASPAGGATLTDPIRVQVTPGITIAERSAGGLAPFYFALTLTLAGFFLATMIFEGIEFASGRISFDVLGRRFERPRVELSRVARLGAALGLIVLAAIVAGVLQTWLAVGVLGMATGGAVSLGLFAALAAATAALVTLFFLTALGLPGRIAAVLVVVIFGVPSSGGPYPPEVLPGVFRFLGEWLPLRHATDGVRALAFYDGRLSAGLGRALWVLALYAVVALVLSLAVAFALDRRALRRAGGAGSEPSTMEGGLAT